MDSLVRGSPRGPALPPRHDTWVVTWEPTSGQPQGPGVANSEFGPCLSCEGLGTRSGGDSGVPESWCLAPEPAVRTQRSLARSEPPIRQALFCRLFYRFPGSFFPWGGSRLKLQQDCSLGPGLSRGWVPECSRAGEGAGSGGMPAGRQGRSRGPAPGGRRQEPPQVSPLVLLPGPLLLRPYF